MICYWPGVIDRPTLAPVKRPQPTRNGWTLTETHHLSANSVSTFPERSVSHPIKRPIRKWPSLLPPSSFLSIVKARLSLARLAKLLMMAFQHHANLLAADSRVILHLEGVGVVQRRRGLTFRKISSARTFSYRSQHVSPTRAEIPLTQPWGSW